MSNLQNLAQIRSAHVGLCIRFQNLDLLIDSAESLVHVPLLDALVRLRVAPDNEHLDRTRPVRCIVGYDYSSTELFIHIEAEVVVGERYLVRQIGCRDENRDVVCIVAEQRNIRLGGRTGSIGGGYARALRRSCGDG